MTQSVQSHRKDEHVFLAEKYFAPAAAAGFDQVRLLHNPLPETAVEHVSCRPALFNWRWPFFINAMTGGSTQTKALNAQLAAVAQACDLAIASGSQSVALREPDLVDTFAVLREQAPTAFIMANLGATADLAAVQAAVAAVGADAIEIHLNTVQEVVMPEGDRDFHWLANLKRLVEGAAVPVVVKEVGFGMTREALAALAGIGVQVVDLGGRGGTNFVTIENARRPDRDLAYLTDFGQTTVESLLEAQGSSMAVIATGGIRTPLDVVKALRLGASVVGISGLILHWLIQDGQAATIARLRSWQAQLPALLAMLGASDLQALNRVPVVLSPTLESYARQRQLPLP
ncbi:type 2 isopentenyl-diphosphate Delta-isomerase [Lacticaseibacillus parakribbianus]|uniref:type 2 isopentenyl-diphosphate Delta-isomerase n=1 Tax=Lacticaseibacillus parakribbianus TaxID=2970927 RepID=UPI0021CB53B7|nr:type 2 isopentenyl-diphosphate Delta-isomerase [Lacticaseibacillus parakribbianus]